MMNTTKCQCGCSSQVWAAKHQPVSNVSECDACKDRPASVKGTSVKPMSWTLESQATRTQFAPNKISR